MTKTEKTLAKAQKLMDKANEIDTDRKCGSFRPQQMEMMVREARLYRQQAQKLIETTF